MDEFITRFVGDLVGRVHGPMHIRVIFQPLMATLFAVLDGRKDAIAGRVPYFWGMFTRPGRRMERLRTGWRAVGKVFIIAMVLDTIYQFRVLGGFYFLETIVTAIILAIIPYVAFRGPAQRLFELLGKNREA